MKTTYSSFYAGSLFTIKMIEKKLKEKENIKTILKDIKRAVTELLKEEKNYNKLSNIKIIFRKTK